MPSSIAGYVKFIRGSKAAFEKLTVKDNDTLYFIYDSEDQTKGLLYLGNKLIGGAGGDVTVPTDINDLANVLVENVADKQILVYDAAQNKWINKTPDEVQVAVMSGASAESAGVSGLVPAPAAGDQDKFLRGDGTWSEVTTLTEEQLNNLSKIPQLDTKVGDLETNLSNLSTRFETLVKDAPEAFDTLVEISNWIAEDKAGSAALVTKVGDLETAMTNMQAVVGDITQFARYQEGDTVVNILNDIDSRLKWTELAE